MKNHKVVDALEIAEVEIEEGQMQKVDLDGDEVLVARVNGQIYAIGGRCTHLRCYLYKGALEGTVVTCPCHGTKFDVATGKVAAYLTNWPKLAGKVGSLIIKDEPVFRVEVKAGKVRLSKPTAIEKS